MVRVVLVVTLFLALAAPTGLLAQSQAGRTGVGGVAVAGQEGGSLATTAIVAGAVIAAAVGIAVAIGGDDSDAKTPVSSVVSTTTR
jgi:hypothetical protein